MVSSYHKVLERLEEHGSRFSRKGDTSSMAQCPAHDDNNPSLEITKTDGKTLLKDHGGCDTEAVVAALGLSMADLYDDDKRRGNNHDKPVGRRARRSTTNRTMTKSTWRRAGAFTFIGQITHTLIYSRAFTDLCSRFHAQVTERRNVAMGDCPNCGAQSLRLTDVAVPAEQSFTLAHCANCDVADLYKAMTTADADLRARVSRADTHLVIYDKEDGVRFTYADGVVVHRRADGKGGKWIRREGERADGKHAPYLSDIVRDYLPKRDRVMYVVEGEKDAASLVAAGYAAVSTLGGAKNVAASTDAAKLLETVSGCRVVCVVDDDKQGCAWADALHGLLSPYVGRDIEELRFIQGRDGIHDAGDAVASGRFEFDIVKHEDVMQDAVQDDDTATTPDSGSERGCCRSAEDVVIRKTEWLHEPLIPLDYLTMISGRSGVSKSTLALHYAALATLGRLDGDYAGTPITVGVTAAEDTDDLVKARFEAAGGDVRRLRFIDISTGIGDMQRTPIFPDDLELLTGEIEHAEVKLWIIDPVTAMMNGDANKLTDVRKVLTPLAALAERLHMAIVLITHFNKGGGYASDKVSGSTAWRDAMRSLIIVAQEEREGGEIVMTLDKSSLTGSAHSSWCYSLMTATVEGVTRDGAIEPVTVTKVGPIMPTSKTVNEVINENNAAGLEAGRPQNREIEDWLMDLLADGPMPFKQIAEAGKEEGYTSRQLHNAQQRSSSIESVPDLNHVGRGRPRVWQITNTAQQPE